MKFSRLSYLLTSVPSVVFLVVVTHADSIQITSTQTPQTQTPGSAVFPNGGSSTTTPPLLTVNDNPFLTNAPLSLAAGAGSLPFETIDLLIAAGSLPGVYAHSYFATLESSAFTEGALSVPEPGTLVLVSFGLLAIASKAASRARSINIIVALDRKSPADTDGQ